MFGKLATIWVDVLLNNGKFNNQLNQQQSLVRRTASQMQRDLLPLKSLLFSGAAIGGGVSLFGFTKLVSGFEQSMSRVKALTNASSSEFEALKLKAREMGKETVFTSRDAAEAMQHFAKAGFSVNEILDSMRPTLDLAAAGNLSIAESANIVVKLMRGMGIEASQLVETVDMMSKAFTTANTDLVQLGEAFKYVGPVAQTLHRPLSEITAAIQLMSDAGLQGAMAGTSLRNILLRLSGEGGAEKAFKAIGFQAADATGKFKPLADLIDELNEKMSKMPEAERAATLMKAFGLRGGPGAAVLMEEGGDKLRAKMRALVDSQGTAARIATTQLDNLSGSWEEFKSKVEDLALVIGDKLLGGMTDFVDKLGIMIETIRNGGQPLADWIVFWGKAVVGIALFIKYGPGLIGLIRAIGVAIHTATGPIGVMTAAVVALTAAIVASDGTFAAFLKRITGLESFNEIFAKIKQSEKRGVGADQLNVAEEARQKKEVAIGQLKSLEEAEKRGVDLSGKKITTPKQRLQMARRKEEILSEIKTQQAIQKKAASEADDVFTSVDISRGLSGDNMSSQTKLARKLRLDATRGLVSYGFYDNTSVDDRLKAVRGTGVTEKANKEKYDAEQKNFLYALMGKAGINLRYSEDTINRAKESGDKPDKSVLADALGIGKVVGTIKAAIAQGPIGKLETAVVNTVADINKMMKDPNGDKSRARFSGIEEFSKGIQESLMNDPVKQTAKNTAKAAKNSDDMKKQQEQMHKALENILKNLQGGLTARAG